MSDRQKGIINAVKKVSLTHSTSIVSGMEKLIVDSEEAWKWVEELPPKTFVKGFFSDFPKCDMVLNNHS
jgi:hypothetical protein